MVTGLIIDAFGELRDQQEQVKEDMEVRVDLILTCSYGARGALKADRRRGSEGVRKIQSYYFHFTKNHHPACARFS